MKLLNPNFFWILLILSCVLFVSGCQSSGLPDPTATVVIQEPVEIKATNTATLTNTPIPTNTPTPTKLPTQTATALPEGVELINLKSPEGIDIMGYLREPEVPLDAGLIVVLAHGHTSSHREWQDFEELMIENGIATMSFDFRGHGASGGSDLFTNIGVDVTTVIDYVKQRGYERIVCIGSSMGGPACLAGAVESAIDGLVMLSSEWVIETRLVSKSDFQALAIPKIFIFTEQDLWTGSTWSVEGFYETAELASEPKEIYVYPGPLHATQMFNADFGEEVLAILLDFVKNLAE